jgi:acetyl-CoA C-acetyltransferase
MAVTAGSDSDVVLVSGARTPIGKFGGALKDLRAHELAAIAIQETLRRTGIDPALLDEVIVGDVIQCCDEAPTARVASVVAGIPVEVPAYTVQKNCASGMQALWCARTQILSDDSALVMVAGTESMSSAPYLLNSTRWGQRLGHGQTTDVVTELFGNGTGFMIGESVINGVTAENIAEKFGISRTEQDEVALRSQNNAEAAIKTGAFKEEIVPVTIKTRKGDVTVDTDEHPRFGLTMEDLTRLKPAFKEGGTVTAGNSSGINDGAAAALVASRKKAKELGLVPMARIVGQACAGVDPRTMGWGPVPATEKLLAKTGIQVDEIGLVELNEAFAAQYVACERGLGLDRNRVNVLGSGIALGHPVGCTGLRIVLTLAYEMRRRGIRYGLATLCVGGGQGMSTLIELEI